VDGVVLSIFAKKMGKGFAQYPAFGGTAMPRCSSGSQMSCANISIYR